MSDIYNIGGKEFRVKESYKITPVDFEKAKAADELVERIKREKMKLNFTAEEVDKFHEGLWAATEPINGEEVDKSFFAKCDQMIGTKIILTFFLSSFCSRIDMGNFLTNWEKKVEESLLQSNESQK